MSAWAFEQMTKEKSVCVHFASMTQQKIYRSTRVTRHSKTVTMLGKPRRVPTSLLKFVFVPHFSAQTCHAPGAFVHPLD